MGLFKSISDAMNEDFVIGERNVARFNADPDSLDDILAEQHARGIGSPRGLRVHSRALERGASGGGGFTAGAARVLLAAALGLAGAAAWSHLQSGGRRRDDE